MLKMERAKTGRLDWLRMDDSKINARARLFGLLALLVPLFAGLQYIVHEGVPRVEVRFVTQDVQTTVPVEVPVERVVERVVYVPVAGQVTVPPTDGLERARASLTSDPGTAGEADAQVGDLPPTDNARRDPDVQAPIAVAELAPTDGPLIGMVAAAPPPAPAAPVVVARAAPAVPVSAPPVYAYAPEEAEADEVIAEVDEPQAVEDDGEMVAEAEVEVPHDISVLQLVSESEVVDGTGASVVMLRHERFSREPAPRAPQAASAEAEAAATDEELGAAVEDQPAGETQAMDGEGASEEPVAEAPAGEATPIPSEDLLAHAEAMKPQDLANGANNEGTFGIQEHVLVVRPAGPPPAAEQHEEAVEAPEAEAAVVAESADADEIVVAEAPDEAVQPEVALTADEDVDDDAPTAESEGDHPHLARTDEGSAPEDAEPEQ